MSLRQVLDIEGGDITGMIEGSATTAGVDEAALLALLIAESALNPKAERWGRETGGAQNAIAMKDWDRLTGIIARTWPDISFGGSQRIVLYHELGDRSPSVNNVLAVRAAVFADPAGDILAAAKRLAGCIEGTADKTPLAGMVKYNSGGDNLHDADWLARWGGNVASYERALAEAETFRATGPTPDEEWLNALAVLNGWALRFPVLAAEVAQGSREIADVNAIIARLRGAPAG
ncbi:MAG: hypothetical protein NTZ05_20380 [Chloroflexi bacterium]|nr:hypothetical protein [Chloroflexota bacterium]